MERLTPLQMAALVASFKRAPPASTPVPAPTSGRSSQVTMAPQEATLLSSEAACKVAMPAPLSALLSSL